MKNDSITRDNVFIRYRIENGVRERNPVKVMAFEMVELDNTDIVEYLLNNHLVQQKANKDFLENIIKGICPYTDYDDNACLQQCEDIIKDIEHTVNRSIRYVLWLTEPAAIDECYAFSEEDGYEIDGYQISDIVLSDLGYDGTLYAYEQNPVPIESKIIHRQLEFGSR